jgi:hypothetical protein
MQLLVDAGTLDEIALYYLYENHAKCKNFPQTNTKDLFSPHLLFGS